MWITHDDADHAGNIQKVLEAAPNAQLAANSLAVLRMGRLGGTPDRVYWLNQGDSIGVGDRKLTAVHRPCSTTRLLSASTITNRKPSSRPIALAPSSRCRHRIPMMFERDLSGHDQLGQWGIPGSIRFNRTNSTGRWKEFVKWPQKIFSAHLPPAKGKTEQFLELLTRVPTSIPLFPPTRRLGTDIGSAEERELTT